MVIRYRNRFIQKKVDVKSIKMSVTKNLPNKISLGYNTFFGNVKITNPNGFILMVCLY